MSFFVVAWLSFVSLPAFSLVVHTTPHYARSSLHSEHWKGDKPPPRVSVNIPPQVLVS